MHQWIDCCHDNKRSSHSIATAEQLVKMSLVLEKQDFLPMRKQRHRSAKADQRLCFHYIDSTKPLLSKSKSSSL